jgi:hypothetical protein
MTLQRYIHFYDHVGSTRWTPIADRIFSQAIPTPLSCSEFRLKPRTCWCRDYLAKSKSYVVLAELQGIILSPLVRIV